MITKISGTLLRLDDDSATLGVEAFEYQVYIAESSRRALQGKVGQPVSLSRTPASIATPTPDAGDHNLEILTELGFDEAAIADLKAEGAI